LGKRLRRLFNIIALLLTIAFAACAKPESDGGDYIFKCVLDANPHTLDPQTATDKNALKVVANLFDGLLKLNADGDIVAGVAAEYTVSGDGLTYTFILREDVYWRDKNGVVSNKPCTAEDFVFAFRRLFNPATKSRNADGYFCIKNGEEAYRGEVSPSEVGVAATDARTLVITLDYPEPDFPLSLTYAPSFPCNEEFYISTNGRYGLNGDSVASNGAFYLSEWVYDPWWTEENRIILRRHSENSEGDHVYPAGVDFLMDRGDAFELINSGATDCAVLSGEKAAALVKNGDRPYSEYENTLYAIIFNENGAFGGENSRKALALATDVDGIAADIAGYRKTRCLIPDSVKVGGKFYRDAVGEINVNFAAGTLTLPNAPPVLIIPEDGAIGEYMGFITQQWQEKLSVYCRVIETASDYESRLASGDYDIAVVKITAGYNSPSAIFEQFGITAVPETAAQFGELETELIESARVIPICFQTAYFFCGKNAADLVYNPFTETVTFRKGKMF